jgi:energy-converting hydrogenase Eha subunit F
MYFGLIRMDGVQLTFHSIPQFVNKDPMFPAQNGTFPMQTPKVLRFTQFKKVWGKITAIQ